MVERHLGKMEVESPILSSGFCPIKLIATLAQLVEHHFRKVGVLGSIPRGGSL